jgi:hypothetical protein
VQRRTPANGPHHLHAGAFAVGALHVDDLVTLAHAQVDRLLDQLVQFAHGRQRRVAHAQAALDQVAQFQQAHAQPVAASLRSIDKPAGGQVVQDAVGGGRVQARLLADFLQGNRLFARRQHIDQRKHPFDHLDGRGRWNAWIRLSHG